MVSSVSLSADLYLIVILSYLCTYVYILYFLCIFYDGIFLLTLLSCTPMYIDFNKRASTFPLGFGSSNDILNISLNTI